LVAGLWLAEALRTERAWVRVAWALPFFAWGANTLRIVVLGAVAVAAGHEAAKGWFHQWGGLAVVVCVFALAGAWVALLARGEASARRKERAAS
jgi:exosortase/archaeosortase family protein